MVRTLRALGTKPDGSALNRPYRLDAHDSVLAINYGSQAIEKAHQLDT